MISRCATVAIVLGALACGDRTSGGGPDPEPAVMRRSAEALERDSTPRGDALIVVPAMLANACISGDPDEGVRWALESVDLASLAFEGIESLAARDSARLAVRIARMVDVIPSDTSIADFRGLPVTVRAAWRFAPAEGDTVVVALAARRMPIESAPLEELFTIIAAPGQRSGLRGPLVDAWFVREVGLEEALVAREFVGAYRRELDTLVLAFAEDAVTGVRAALIERRAGRWHTGWSGPLPSCPTP